MLTHWKRLTCQGNQNQEHGELIRARHLYRAALAEAERWLVLMEQHHGTDADDANCALAAYVASQRNLADLACCCNHPDAAFTHLASAYDRLLMVFADARLPATLRNAARHHSERARRLLLQHCDGQGQPRHELPRHLDAFVITAPLSLTTH